MITKSNRDVSVQPLASILVVFVLFSATAQADTWSNTQYNNGVNLKQSQVNEMYFQFPNSGHVNLIARSWITPIQMGATISITYKIRPNATKPWFQSLDKSPSPPGLKPNFRPMLF